MHFLFHNLFCIYHQYVSPMHDCLVVTLLTTPHCYLYGKRERATSTPSTICVEFSRNLHRTCRLQRNCRNMLFHCQQMLTLKGGSGGHAVRQCGWSWSPGNGDICTASTQDITLANMLQFSIYRWAYAPNLHIEEEFFTGSVRTSPR